MENLIVNPERLHQLVPVLEDAAKQVADAASVAPDVRTQLWVTHGVASGVSNDALTNAAAARQAAAKALEKSCTELAEKLRRASAAYTSIDEQTANTIDQ